GYNLLPKRSVNKMNATTARPTSAPITSVETRNTCPSRSRRMAAHCGDETPHRLLEAGRLAHMAFVFVARSGLKKQSFGNFTTPRAFPPDPASRSPPGLRLRAGKPAGPSLAFPSSPHQNGAREPSTNHQAQ